MMTGYATHHVPSGRVPALIDALAQTDLAVPEALEAVLDRFHSDPGPSPLAAHRALIDRCFAADRVEEIVSRLAAEGGSFATTTAEIATRNRV